jgi:multidrug efflux pump subunit AcrA (membrane-fusion protein)
MKRAIPIVVVLILLAGGAYAAYRHFQAQPDHFQQAATQLGLGAKPAQPGALLASGIVEAHSVVVASELGGRITAIDVAEGDTVVAGQPLLAVDGRALQARIAQVDASVDAAEAQLALLLAGARAEVIAQAQAQLAQAEVASDAAKQAWEDAKLLRERPDELDLKIVEAETAVAVAEHQAAAAKLQAEAADLQSALWGRVVQMLEEGFDVTLPFGGSYHVDKPAEREQASVQWNVSSQQVWEAWQAAYAAGDAVDAARTALGDLRRQRSSLIALDARIGEADAVYQRSLAGIDQARAAVRGLQEGATPEEIEVARQAVEQARSSGAALQVQLDKTQAVAPLAGLVTQVVVHPGEVTLPGTPLLEIADLSKVTLKVYVSLLDLGRVRVGQPVQVAVDSFPDRVFEGRVTQIADQGEFTPKTVQAQEERVNTVFAVEIGVDNPDGALKPGMPADVIFREGNP